MDPPAHPHEPGENSPSSQIDIICENPGQELADFGATDMTWNRALKLAARAEMESGEKDKQVSEGDCQRSHYCVLYTQGIKQWEVAETIKRALSEEEGEVFYPCVELWWHGLKKTRYKPLFPGYLFIRSEMEAAKLHDVIRRSRREILTFVKELGANEKRVAGEDAFNGSKSEIIDLSSREAAFFDCLLGFRFDADLDRRREEAEQEGHVYKAPVLQEEPSAEADSARAAVASEIRRRKKRIPEKGVVQMSFGYRENGRYVIMDGPLKGLEERIVDYKPKDQKAYLDISVGGRITKVGLMVLGKKMWFPKEKNVADILDDGTEVDCRELTRIMNSGGIGSGR